MITFPRIFHPMVVATVAGQTLDGTGVLARPPRIAFSVTKSIMSEPDSATLQVWGLNPARRGAIAGVFAELGFAPMTITSGYDGVTVPLFTGDIRKLQAGVYARATVPLVATGDDAGDVIAESTVPASLKSTIGFNAQNMIDAAILSFAQPVISQTTGQLVKPGAVIVPHPSVAEAIATAQPAAVTTTYTFVNVSKATDLLDEAARLLQCRWWIRDGFLYMARRGLPTDKLAVLLPRSHWLEEPSEEGEGTVSLATFLDPNLQPGRQVILVGRNAPAEQEPFRVESGTYTGDTESNTPWRAQLRLQRIIPLG